MRQVRLEDLRGCLTRAFERFGLEPGDAAGLAGLLLDSELRGHRDHGIAALAPLTAMYSDGRLNPRPRVQVLSETDGAAARLRPRLRSGRPDGPTPGTRPRRG